MREIDDGRIHFLPYIGGKFEIAPWIVERFPLGYERLGYVEPFGGALAVFLHKRPSDVEVISDINGDLVNLWYMVQQCPEKVIEECNKIPFAQAVYERMASDWQEGFRPPDPVLRAAWTYYLGRSTFSAKQERKSGWSHSIQRNQAATYYMCVQDLHRVSERLRNCQIAHISFEKVFAQYDASNALFYCDPPFVGSEKRYRGEFGEEHHRKLADLLNGVRGKALLSYYDHPLIRELYPSPPWFWHRREVAMHSNGTTGEDRFASGGKKKNKETGVLICNYEKKHATGSLFEDQYPPM